MCFPLVPLDGSVLIVSLRILSEVWDEGQHCEGQLLNIM